MPLQLLPISGHLTFIWGPSDDPPFEVMRWDTLRLILMILVGHGARVREAVVRTQLTWLLLWIL